jgi:hypothetical protein
VHPCRHWRRRCRNARPVAPGLAAWLIAGNNLLPGV